MAPPHSGVAAGPQRSAHAERRRGQYPAVISRSAGRHPAAVMRSQAGARVRHALPRAVHVPPRYVASTPCRVARDPPPRAAATGPGRRSRGEGQQLRHRARGIIGMLGTPSPRECAIVPTSVLHAARVGCCPGIANPSSGRSLPSHPARRSSPPTTASAGWRFRQLPESQSARPVTPCFNASPHPKIRHTWIGSKRVPRRFRSFDCRSSRSWVCRRNRQPSLARECRCRNT